MDRLVGVILLYSLKVANIFFIVSAGGIFLFNVYAIVAYIRHLVLIRRINNTESVVADTTEAGGAAK